MVDFTITFTPFMIGALSLIGFLGFRNVHLSKNTRELCTSLRNETDSFWESSLTLQLSCFVRRYMRSNLALMFAIFSVFLFGCMIAWMVLFSHIYTTNFVHELPLVMLILGGIFGTVSTLICINETWLARQSLSAHVATTIIGVDFSKIEPSLHVRLMEIENCIGRSLDKELHGKLKEKMSHVLTVKQKTIPPCLPNSTD